ncbi:MAG: NAD(P)/FAD-dependent oxidoreductase [Pseudomonadota bacterium]
MIELLIVGAGPAGMSAALEASSLGKTPVVIDNRPEPGGNIYSFLGSNRQHRSQRMKIFGPDYAKGAKLLDAFVEAVSAEKVIYHPNTRLWRLDQDGAFAYDGPMGSRAGQAKSVVLATGAQERPMPLPGWTLPGVMGVGAAQILLKSGGELPSGDIVVVGSGPLPLLLTVQLAKAGRPVKAVVEPDGASALLSATSLAHHAVAAPKTAMKGIMLLAKRALRRTPVWRKATAISVDGDERATGIKFRSGKEFRIDAENVLLHDGIVPNLNPVRAANLTTDYSEQQKTWHAQSNDVIRLAGDGAGILGADAAVLSGRLAAREICGTTASSADLSAMAKQRSFRKFIDRAYPPVCPATNAAPDTVLCRCEMIRAHQVEQSIATHGTDPNAIKRALRVGMGPCQGRMCGHSLADFVGSKTQTTSEAVGLPRARNPILPVSFQILAELD